jgi:serine/threonine-protein kinase RsbT
MSQSLALADHPVASLPVLLGGLPEAEGARIDLPAILDGTIVPIATTADIFTAREEGRVLAAHLGFSAWDQTMIASTISELARNMLEFATKGRIALTTETLGNRVGLVIEARDHGPGIADPARAVAGGGSSSKGRGFGLPGVNRLMDELDIASELGKGTTVTAKKWRRAGAVGWMADVGPVWSGQGTGPERRSASPPPRGGIGLRSRGWVPTTWRHAVRRAMRSSAPAASTALIPIAVPPLRRRRDDNPML